MRRKLILVPLAALCVLGLAEASPDHEVHQKNRRFSDDDLTVRRGEPVVFVNDDTVPHNVMSEDRNNGFDVGQQAPDRATPVTFTVAGTVVVICAIHPLMRMTIHVTD